MLPYEQLIDVGTSADMEQLRCRLIGAAGSLGFGLAGGALIRGRYAAGSAKVHPLSNPPAAFVEASRSNAIGVRDPLLTCLLSRGGFVAYDQAFYAAAGAGDLWDLQAPYGYRCGLAFAMHEPAHAEVFSFGFDSHDPLPTRADALLELKAALQLLTVHAHSAARRLTTSQRSRGAKLTGTELECLKWASDGVTVWRTGELLRISEASVREQRRSAAAKLGAATTSAAVLTAIDGGLLNR